MGLQLIPPPLVEPVALRELKEFPRVNAGDDTQDNLRTTLGTGARGLC
jgi:hypothetical protein